MKEHISKIKDIVYILSFVGVLIGWYTTASVDKALLTKAVEDLTLEVSQINTALDAQLEFNGKILQYIEMDNHE